MMPFRNFPVLFILVATYIISSVSVIGNVAISMLLHKSILTYFQIQEDESCCGNGSKVDGICVCNPGFGGNKCQHCQGRYE